MAMLEKLYWLLLYGNFSVAVFVYLYLLKIKRLIGFQLGMNITMIVGGFLSIATGIILIYQFPFHYVVVTFISTFTGMAVGSIFGALFDYQTILTGYANGLMMGIMAPMVGAAAKSSLLFLLFIEGLFLLSMALIISSAKYT
ncbi:hypothetical protein ACLIBH_07860 [Virgibacillus sp. W0430]|uniref:hypothetical protein n=1 Tax=Virgibacillus sp. W0430 TaxID=3391580 RepID=UPI003F453624